MSGKEALNVPRRLESLHDPLSSSGRLMGVFGPVIEALVLPMLGPGHDLPLGSGVALQLVGDEDTRISTLLLEELAEQAFGASRPISLGRGHADADCGRAGRLPRHWQQPRGSSQDWLNRGASSNVDFVHPLLEP